MPPTARFLLRDAIAASHRHIDLAFAAFDLSNPNDYGRFLRAHARAVPALESAVDAAMPWSGWSRRSPALLADLEELGGEMPSGAVAVPALSEHAAWGIQYVLEGSKLGGNVLAARVGAGLPRRYLAAHDPAAWISFQAELNEALGVEDQATIDFAIGGARLAFSLFEDAIGPERAAS